MLEIELLRGGAEIIASLASEWGALYAEGGRDIAFLRPEWFTALVASFKKKNLEIVAVRKEGMLRAVLPLMRRRSQINGVPVRKLQAVFNPNTPQFDLLHGADERERDEVVEGIWNELEQSKGWDAIECRLVRTDSWLLDLVKISGSRGFPSGVWHMDTAPYVEVPPIDGANSIDSFFSGKRKHLGKELTRRLRRLEERGSVEFIRNSRFSPEMIGRFFELEKKGWKGKGNTAAVQDERSAQLHKNFSQSMGDAGDLMVYELRIDSVTIAMSLNIKCRGRVLHWKTTYDEEFSRYSPGNLLFRKLLTDCASESIHEIDFLCPSLPYKTVWATGEREHVAIYIFRPALVGWVSWLWKFRVVTHVRRLKQAYPKLFAAVGGLSS